MTASVSSPRGGSPPVSVPRLLRAEGRRALLAVALGLVGQLSALGLLATSGWLIATSSLRPPILTLTVAIAAVRMFALLRGLGRYGERLAGHDTALRILARLRVWAFERLERVVPGGLGTVSSGDLLSRVVSDVDGTQDLVVRALIPAATTSATALAAAVLAGMILPSAGLLLAAGLVAVGVAVPLAGRRVGRTVSAGLAAERGRVAGLVVEAVEAAPDIVAFGASRQTLTALASSEGRLSRALARSAVISGVADALGVLVAVATTMAVIVVGVDAMGAGTVAARGLGPVDVAVLAFVSLAGFDSVRALPEVFVRLDAMLDSSRRVRSLGDLRPPVAEPAQPLPLPAGEPALELRGASVAYGPSRPAALDRVDVTLAPGRRIAVVGASGAGKSTLALALLRFVELSTGCLHVNGTDARLLDSDQIRALVAWAPQDPHIFAATVAVNLRLARPDASDDDLVQVLDLVGLGSWLDGLPEHLASPLGERGSTLSGGERQRVGVARALLAERPVLVLDEPTAHLDTEGEQTVRNAVLAAGADRAILWITHRLVGLEDFDEIVVLDRGRVAERGTVAELARRDGPFRALLEATT